MKLICGVVFICSLIGLFFLESNLNKITMQDCNSRFIIYDSENKKIELNISFAFFSKAEGLLTMNGVYHHNDITLPIYRQMFFKYNLTKSTLYLRSQKLNKFNSDMVDANHELIPLPAFYLSTGKEIYYDLEKDSSGTLFSRGKKIPLFYCWNE